MTKTTSTMLTKTNLGPHGVQLDLFPGEYDRLPSPVTGMSWAEYVSAQLRLGGPAATRLRAAGWMLCNEDGADA